jgi:hypothetical protein
MFFTHPPLVVTLHDARQLKAAKGRWPLCERVAVHALPGEIKRRVHRANCVS